MKKKQNQKITHSQFLNFIKKSRYNCSGIFFVELQSSKNKVESKRMSIILLLNNIKVKESKSRLFAALLATELFEKFVFSKQLFSKQVLIFQFIYGMLFRVFMYKSKYYESKNHRNIHFRIFYFQLRFFSGYISKSKTIAGQNL